MRQREEGGSWAAGARLVTAVLCAMALTACGGEDEGADAQERPPQPVMLSELQPETANVVGEYAGRLRGSREVEVRAQVSGILQERLYLEGQRVDEGVALFRIDQAPYEIALKRARAELANAEATLNQAQREWRRISGLYDQNAVSERERDRVLSTYELAQASAELAEAGVAQAELDLAYTEVAAPVAGATGLETVSEGSLIERGGLLTTITQLDPVHVRFALPEEDAALQRMVRRKNGDETRREARLVLPDGTEHSVSGEVNFTDSTIDARTGTVSARAVFPNEDFDLVPGQFVRVRIVLQPLENALLVDARAVVQTQEGPAVFVMDADNVVEQRLVELGPLIEGRQVLTSGVEAGEQVVVNGLPGLTDGATVAPREAADEEG